MHHALRALCESRAVSRSYRDLLSLTDDELITAHDEIAPSTSVGVNYYLDELRRREQARSNQLIIRLTFANAALAALAVVISMIALVVAG
jgi:hypothetical protein